MGPSCPWSDMDPSCPWSEMDPHCPWSDMDPSCPWSEMDPSCAWSEIDPSCAWSEMDPSCAWSEIDPKLSMMWNWPKLYMKWNRPKVVHEVKLTQVVHEVGVIRGVKLHGFDSKQIIHRCFRHDFLRAKDFIVTETIPKKPPETTLRSSASVDCVIAQLRRVNYTERKKFHKFRKFTQITLHTLELFVKYNETTTFHSATISQETRKINTWHWLQNEGTVISFHCNVIET